MTTKRSIKITSEAQEQAEEVVSTSEVDAVKMTLDDYLKTAIINPGLVASFRYEAAQVGDQLAARTETDWANAFEVQSNKTYD